MEVIAPVPLNQVGVFGMLLYAETGQMGKAAEIARGDAARVPFGFHAYIRGCMLAAAGDRAGAREIWTKGLHRSRALVGANENAAYPIVDSLIYAKLGSIGQARQNVAKALAAEPHHPVRLFFAAQVRALLGDRREALDSLKEAVKNGFFNLPMIEYHSRPGLGFHRLYGDPEFDAIRADLTRRIDAMRAHY